MGDERWDRWEVDSQKWYEVRAWSHKQVADGRFRPLPHLLIMVSRLHHIYFSWYPQKMTNSDPLGHKVDQDVIVDCDR